VGAHFYGFPSTDSDLDLKGIHLAPLTWLLGLDPPPETHDALHPFEGHEHDLTTHEAAKALSLLLRGNGNVLERLMSPMQLFESDDLAELRALARGSLSRCFAGHYRGYFLGMQRAHGRARGAKTMLYAYRVALTGIHLLETGECVGDVRTLADAYGIEGVDELVERKREGGEKSVLPEALDLVHRERWPALEARFKAADARSGLPEVPPNRAAIDEWLVRRRMQ
jgi:predicted nucleotidyltransferase